MKKLLSLLLAVSLVFPLVSNAAVFGFATQNDLNKLEAEIIPVLQQVVSLLQQAVKTHLLGSAATITQGGALYDGYLASQILKTDTSMTLSTGVFRDNTSLSGWNCFTVDVNSPSVEYICGTASGTAVTGLWRGVSLTNPNTTSSALAYLHNRFAPVQITDYPDLQILKRLANGNDTFPNVLSYSSLTNAQISNSTSNIPNVNYVNSVASSGAAAATTGVGGLVMLGTQSQLQTGTATGTAGGTDYSLVPQNKFLSSTSTATTTVVVTRTTGKLDPNFIDSTANYSFSNQTLSISTATSTASSSIDALNVVPAGVVEMYASSTAPSGWLLADGSEYTTSTYPRLWKIIGYLYGGSTSTFKVPNLGGRTIFGPSSTISTVIGSTGGSTSTYLTSSTMPNYSIWSGVSGVGAGGNANGYAYGASGGAQINTANLGQGNALGLMNPYMILNYIIKY